MRCRLVPPQELARIHAEVAQIMAIRGMAETARDGVATMATRMDAIERRLQRLEQYLAYHTRHDPDPFGT